MPQDQSSLSSKHQPEDIPIENPKQDDPPQEPSPVPIYPSPRRALIIVAGLFLTVFLIALDRLIIGVAVPKITDEFNSLGDVGWYGSSYLLTVCAFGLFMGRIYTFYDPKWVYLSSLVVFEIGSAVCGAAPNSNALIVGRAIAGLGNAGLFQGAIVIFVHILPLHKRPQYTGFLGMVFGVASAVGPLLGGAFTDGPGWRWCFYINLPLGGVVLLLHIFFLHIPKESLQTKPSTISEKAARLDPIGTFFFLPAIICLLLALQWGGLTYNWSNARIIVLLILFGICFIIFALVQRWKGENATVPGHIFFNRSIMAGAWFSFFIGSAQVSALYFLPLWFQAVKGETALKSGLMILPMIIGMVVASITAGISTKKIGYYAPWMIASSVIMPIGAGLISTFTPTTDHAHWIGYQVLFGFGLGLGQQQASVAAQTVLARKDVPTGASLMMFCQTLGGAVFISVGNNLLDTKLQTGLAGIPGIDSGAVVNTGATDLRTMVPAGVLPQILKVYNTALQETFYLITAVACATIVGSLAMEWKSVKKEKSRPQGEKSAV